MHTITFTSTKGGAGATVVACAHALAMSRDIDVALVSPDGDAALGVASGPDWVQVNERLRLYSDAESMAADPWARTRPLLVIDRTTGRSLPHLDWPDSRHFLVTRPCYLALRRGVAMRGFEGVILITEPGRALRSEDISGALGLPVVAEIPLDPAIARAVDAGLLAARPPRTLGVLAAIS